MSPGALPHAGPKCSGDFFSEVFDQQTQLLCPIRVQSAGWCRQAHRRHGHAVSIEDGGTQAVNPFAPFFKIGGVTLFANQDQFGLEFFEGADGVWGGASQGAGHELQCAGVVKGQQHLARGHAVSGGPATQFRLGTNGLWAVDLVEVNNL